MARRSFKFILLVGLLSLVPSAQAQEMERNNNMRSGNGIWRIELRDLKQFLSMSSGDSDGISEVHSVSVRLIGREGQFQTVTEKNPYLSINGGNSSNGNSINVRQGDSVFLNRFAQGQTDTYNMWIHTAEVTGGDIDGPMLRFEIRVDARELDCTGDRVCQRGSNGVVTYHFSIPTPARKDNTCNAHNTYRITLVDGSNMVLEPLNAASGRGNDIRVRHTLSGGHIVGLGARGDNSGVELAMTSGRICAAWTGG